jgi:hypothetical protein
MPKKKVFQELIFKKKYKTYNDFHVDNKEIIYKTIINLFKEFQLSKNKLFYMLIHANIENIEWSTELSFNKNEFYILKKDIMPHFEEIEDYETCSEIINITKGLDLIKN